MEELDNEGDIQYSTGFTDSQDDLVYKHYKVQKFNLNGKVIDYYAKISHFKMQVRLYKAGLLSKTKIRGVMYGVASCEKLLFKL